MKRGNHTLYDLYAVIVHKGNADSGHYIAFVKHGNEWYKSDDRTVTLVRDTEVLHAQAYILFYCKQS